MENFQEKWTELRALPGVGDYTAAAIAAIAFDIAAVPVDGNVERVVSRLFAVEEELPAAKPKIKQLAASLLPGERSGDFAQAFMDLGATICSPKRPACALCPWVESLRRTPARRPGNVSPQGAQTGRTIAPRRGLRRSSVPMDACCCASARTRVCLRRMTEVPGSAWAHDFDEKSALRFAPRLKAAKWARVPGVVRHVFTHFPLELAVFRATVTRPTKAPANARWAPLADLAGEALPNVMRKVIVHALDNDGGGKHGRRRG